MFTMPETDPADRRACALALALIVFVTLARCALLAFDPPNLSFDEAQYWAWAQSIQLGYYSKPPMVAWAIAATTARSVSAASSLGILSSSVRALSPG